MRFHLDRSHQYVLALFRVVFGLLFACHGLSSLFGVLGGAMGTGKTLPVSWPGWYAALIQLVFGLLVLFGVGTRIAALACSGSMAYAYFTVHMEKALWPIQNGGELAALYCWAFLLIVVTGPGAFAVDGLFAKRNGTTGTSTGRSDAGPLNSGTKVVAASE